VGHKIGKDEDVGAALIRLVRDDLAAARAGLRGNGGAPRRIHRARQRLKRARSLLKVLKPALGPNALTAKTKIRAAARLLAGARDADAAAASARGLRAEAGDGNGASLDRLVTAMSREAAAKHARTPAMATAAALISDAEFSLAGLNGKVAGADLLERALAKSFREGSRALRCAEDSLAMPDLHRWRKEVKHLWHLLRLSRKRLPARANKLAGKLEKLGHILGVDHDHAILATKLADGPSGEPTLTRRFALIARKRRALEAEAFALGDRFYGKSPKRFARRLNIG
jgi:CHAD domain-containing protein